MFTNRTEAGRLLVKHLPEVDSASTVVVALPRGGLPVAAEIAEALDLPLDIVLVRKVGAPAQPELAVAAVSDGAEMRLSINEGVAAALGLDNEDVRLLAQKELPELERRHKLYRGDRSALPLSGKTVIVVDDGVATGATVRSALHLIRQNGARRIILALPVAPAEVVKRLKGEVDDLICLETPSPFLAVGAHYASFEQVDDFEVIQTLKDAHERYETGHAT